MELASPQSASCGLSSVPSSKLPEVKFLWITEGEHFSCRYLITTRILWLTINIESTPEIWQCRGWISYSNAHALPKAIFTRVFHVRGLLSSSDRCRRSCSEPIFWKSYIKRCCPCSEQYPTSSVMFGCRNWDTFETSSMKSSLMENNAEFIFITARTCIVTKKLDSVNTKCMKLF